jgi:predicted transposase/invertase (TIGR01784 family)
MDQLISIIRQSDAILRSAQQAIDQGQRLDIRNDVVFKTVFAGDRDDSRRALCSLASAFTNAPVRDLVVLNNELLPEHLLGKVSHLDLHLMFNGGEQMNIEIQNRRTRDDLLSRAHFYAGKLTASQLVRGDNYRNLHRVYQVFLLNYIEFENSQTLERNYLHTERHDHAILDDKENIYFIELPRLRAFKERYVRGELLVKGLSLQEKWSMFIRYQHNPQLKNLREELCQAEEGIMHANAVVERTSANMNEWAKQLFREKVEMDYYADMSASREEGREEGQEQKAIEIARNMKAARFPLDQIMTLTGLSLQEIEEL